jgi:hypothetical protein
MRRSGTTLALADEVLPGAATVTFALHEMPKRFEPYSEKELRQRSGEATRPERSRASWRRTKTGLGTVFFLLDWAVGQRSFA